MINALKNYPELEFGIVFMENQPTQPAIQFGTFYSLSFYFISDPRDVALVSMYSISLSFSLSQMLD